MAKKTQLEKEADKADAVNSQAAIKTQFAPNSKPANPEDPRNKAISSVERQGSKQA